ncbi:MAG TPA: nuclear transport factor 2 family protein [Vicinamibacterales bacterium]|nr:nuclear transport factor 2 family protein [Vicinamibacterales bacterium]
MTQTSVANRSDLESLTGLNATYIYCVVTADTRRFAEILSDDFLCSNPDGSLVDKPAFLRQIERIGTFASMDLDDVRIRIVGDVAVIHAATRFTLADGRTGRGRYTDGWAKRNGQWLAVFAHVTRIAD